MSPPRLAARIRASASRPVSRRWSPCASRAAAPSGCFTPGCQYFRWCCPNRRPTARPVPISSIPICRSARGKADRLDIFDTAAPAIAFSPSAPSNTVPGSGPDGAVVPYSASGSEMVDELLGVDVTVSCTIDGQAVPAVFDDPASFLTERRRSRAWRRDSHGNSPPTTSRSSSSISTPPVVTVPGNVTLAGGDAGRCRYTFMRDRGRQRRRSGERGVHASQRVDVRDRRDDGDLRGDGRGREQRQRQLRGDGGRHGRSRC